MRIVLSFNVVKTHVVFFFPRPTDRPTLVQINASQIDQRKYYTQRRRGLMRIRLYCVISYSFGSCTLQRQYIIIFRDKFEHPYPYYENRKSRYDVVICYRIVHVKYNKLHALRTACWIHSLAKRRKYQ